MMMGGRVAYVYLNSASSSGTHPDNTHARFTAQLPVSLDLTNCSIALAEICFSPDIAALADTHYNVFVDCDLVGYSIVSDGCARILRTIALDATATPTHGGVYKTFSDLQYFRSDVGVVTTAAVTLRAGSGAPLPLDATASPTWLMLKIRFDENAPAACQYSHH